MKIPTPRTDANNLGWRFNEQNGDFDSLSDNPMPWLDFAKMLERELTIALAEIDRLDVSGIHSCHSECKKSNCVLRRELAAATKQRDELADLTKQFIEILDITEESANGRLFHPTNITSCRAGDLQKIRGLFEALRRASR
jgi:hypothetical protein